MGVNSLTKTVTRQRRDCDLNPGPSAPESSTLTTRLTSHIIISIRVMKTFDGVSSVVVGRFPLERDRAAVELVNRNVLRLTRRVCVNKTANVHVQVSRFKPVIHEQLS